MCASNSFPGLFAPFRFEGRHLLEGGILNNFPIDVVDRRPDHDAPAGRFEAARSDDAA